MQSTEQHRVDQAIEWRLRAALDRITPPASAPRYASVALRAFKPWRVAPFLLAAATSILLAVTATATTGSPNPVVWTGDAAQAIGSVAHPTEAIPMPPATAPQPPPAQKAAAPAPAPDKSIEASSPKPTPSERPEDSPRPGQAPSGGQWDDRSGSGWPDHHQDTSTSSHSGSWDH